MQIIKHPELYKGLLKYIDGRKELVEIPGGKDSQGTLLIPENLAIHERYFKLDNAQESDEWFEYTEIVMPNANIVPFKRDLH